MHNLVMGRHRGSQQVGSARLGCSGCYCVYQPTPFVLAGNRLSIACPSGSTRMDLEAIRERLVGCRLSADPAEDFDSRGSYLSLGKVDHSDTAAVRNEVLVLPPGYVAFPFGTPPLRDSPSSRESYHRIRHMYRVDPSQVEEALMTDMTAMFPMDNKHLDPLFDSRNHPHASHQFRAVAPPQYAHSYLPSHLPSQPPSQVPSQVPTYQGRRPPRYPSGGRGRFEGRGAGNGRRSAYRGSAQHR